MAGYSKIAPQYFPYRYAQLSLMVILNPAFLPVHLLTRKCTQIVCEIAFARMLHNSGCISRTHSPSQGPLFFAPRCWPFTSKCKTLKKVKFFNKKWQVNKYCPLILPVKSERFFACYSGPIHETSLIQCMSIFERFFSFCAS